MSQINFCCPSCHQQLVVGAEMQGRQVQCSSCQTAMVVPQAPASHPHGQMPSNPIQPTGVPGEVKFLAWYYMIGAIPFIVLALFGFAIPPEDLTNHPEHIDRDRAFLQGLKLLMFGGLLIYSGIHLIGGIGLHRGRKWGYRTAWILSILGAIHLNPFAIPGFVICLRDRVRKFFA